MGIRHKYLKGVATLSLDRDKCVGCGICQAVCPHGVFDMGDRKAFITDKDFCMECGACALNCPAQAISVDSGVGCAAAHILSGLTGGEPVCSCGTSDSGSSTRCC